jgi:hypothetical protein
MKDKARQTTAIGVRLLVACSVLTTGAVFAQPPAPEGAVRPAPSRPEGGRADNFRPYDEVTKGYRKITPADTEASLYTLWVRDEDNQMLAELPRNFANQRHFIALTVASGETFAGLQLDQRYVYWRRVNDRMVLIEPNIDYRASGDNESKASVERLFTDRVLIDIPIVTLTPQRVPVIDLDELLVGQASTFFRIPGIQGAKRQLATIKTAKAFPENIEVAYELPMADGRLKTLHYSISIIPDNTGYRPRVADQRVGYFTTSYSDYSKYREDETRVRYIQRWHLEKADPRLRLSPPKEPIEFYIEHTTPKRYRYWVEQGILYWNSAFERIGIRNAIVVHQQDAETKRYMDLDPEDRRYNFVRWLNNDVGTAIGPSRVHPLTGQILDADIVLTDGWIRHYERQFNQLLPKLAVEGFSPNTLAWLNAHPNWDPRVLMASPEDRPQLLARRAQMLYDPQSSHPVSHLDPAMLDGHDSAQLLGHVSHFNGMCRLAEGKAVDLAILRSMLELWAIDEIRRADAPETPSAADDNEPEQKGEENKDEEKKDEEKKEDEKKEEKKEPKDEDQMLDGVPERFIGPLLAELVAHEVGHTLGLRHNFKASSIYTLEEINSEKLKGKPHAGSVMDYLPINIQVDKDAPHGDHTMLSVGPYDYWAIEYGYTFESNLQPILDRVAEPELAFATDEDTWGPDPTAWRYDFSKNPLDYAKSQMKLAEYHRARLLEDFVKKGDSWEKARRGYELTLALQVRSLSMMANWVGGAMLHRDKKGDANARPPLEVVSADTQREALQFVIEHAFKDDAFGLTPDLLRHLGVDKWLDNRSLDGGDWPVHDRIMGIQGSVLTMLMNPDTLRLVYDNELRTPGDQDMLTLPELLDNVSTAIWAELDQKPAEKATARTPWISSFRRNVQREHLQRLIDLTLPDAGWTAAYKPISNLAMLRLQELGDKIGQSLQQRALLDPYTVAHLNEAKLRIEKAIDAQFIYNVDRFGGRLPTLLFFQGGDQQPQLPNP